MTEIAFRGVLTALVTPFRDGAVDEAAMARLIERQIAAGVHGLVPVGTTGESATLSHEEHRRVVSLTVEVAARRVPVIAGAGSYATNEAIELAQQAREAGADAALVVTPYYNRPSQEGLFLHYQAVAQAAGLPIVIYNVPSRTSVDISNATLERLAKLPGITGVKDATGDMGRASLQRRAMGPGWVMLSGDDPSALGYMASGGHGCISVTSNVAPAQCVRFYDACLAGDWQTALELQNRLIRLHKGLFLDASPAPTKFVLAHLGLCSAESRLPIAPCAEEVKAEILAALAEAEAA
jgi:4-hydroxy-tetrahydrodipicolinate synthase